MAVKSEGSALIYSLSIRRRILKWKKFAESTMPKVSLDMPQELVDDLKIHVGDEHKFVSLADAIRTACRKLLDQLDSIDKMHGRRMD
tara:strand:+ start:266 stop:526 length:261 start_codon:yes stop_codon:yes gene_type:complete